VVIQGAEAAHLVTVCRLQAGQRVRLFNGNGREYLALITAADRRRATLEVLGEEKIDRELPHRLTVACPLPRGDRGQFLLEKLTELGVYRYIPLLTERTVRDPGGSRLAKLQRWVIEACKQCGRNVLMGVVAPTPWPMMLQALDLPGLRLLAATDGELLPSSLPAKDAIVAVGPEGGLTEAEKALATETGWRTVSLGCRILRVETAALTLAACFAVAWGRERP